MERISVKDFRHSSPPPPQAYTYEVPGYRFDSTITAKVKVALLNDNVTGALAVRVETFKGRVELSGFAKTAADKQRAGEIASSVRGVESVVNGLVVGSNP
jgi:hyperosmotically inducible protein